MRILNINARSIVNKSDQLEAIILGYNPHIVVLTETWLHSGIDDEDVFPPSYSVFRRDRSTRGGGVAVLVKQNLSATLLCQADSIETISLKISYYEHSFLLFAVYRAPGSPPQFLCDLREHVSSFVHKKLFLVGDFNLPGVNWEHCSSSGEFSTHVNYMREIILCHNLHQVVNLPTRVHGSSSSMLDLVFVSKTIENFSVSIEHGMSDHRMVYYSCHLKKCTAKKAKTVQVKDFTRARDESVLDYLDLHLSNFHGSNVVELWDKFKKICTYCIENFVPTKTKKTGNENPWITREVIHLKRKIKRLRRRNASPTTVQNLQATLSSSIGHAKRHYFNNTLPHFIRTAPEKFWKFLSKKNKAVDQIIKDGIPVVEKQSIAEHFNAFFHSVFINSEELALPFSPLSNVSPEFVSAQGVLSMILNLKTKSTPGPDNIPNVFLRRYAEMLSHFLVIIFGASLSTAALPPDWRTARVVPVPKKGDPTMITNYRPISLTSSCCKMLEHVIANFIRDFLEDNNILSPAQHGFRKGFSTVTQLTTVIHSLARILDKSGQVDVIFLDFRKAFDLVSHSKLIEKLKMINLPPFIINWVAAYVTDRRQFVNIDTYYSHELPVTSGVPQGSVLGPLLFLIYINDIVSVITEPVQIRLFADDCVLFREVSSEDDQITLNNNLQNILSWCHCWDMQLNADKTVYMKITKKLNNLSFPYALGTEPLTEVSEYKYLGVTLTNSLNWNTHITNVCDTAFRKLCLLRHKLKHVPAETKLLAYTSLIRPKLEYACVVWDPYTKTNIDALERIQRKAVRFIFSKYRTTDSPTALMKQHGIPTLELRRKIQRLKFMFLLKNNLLALTPDPYITLLTARRTRHRHDDSLTPYSTRTNVFKYSFFPRTITDWNNLPLPLLTSVDSIETLNCS